MAAELRDQFLRAATMERLALVRDPANAAELRTLLGDDALADYVKLAAQVDKDHLAPESDPTVLFAPGVMGSLIDSRLGGVWWVDVRTRDHLNDLALSPDGSKDADPHAGLRAFQVDTSYEPFLLSFDSTEFGFESFPYDWRKPLTTSTDALVALVEQMRAKNGDRPVHLVGHSMGGLMIRAALMEHPELWRKIGRVIFIGTPHDGSPAIAGYLKNHLWGFDLMALLGFFLDRATFRSLWGVLAMLPAPAGIYPGTRPNDPDPWPAKQGEYPHPCANFDLYDVEGWHLDLKADEADRLKDVLAGARDFHEQMAEAHAGLANEQLDRMAVIAGVGQKTLFRLEWQSEFWGAWKHAVKITDRIPGDRHREGDGRVPLASAELDGVRVRYVRGVHGGLPNIPAVYKAVFAALGDQDMPLPDTPEQALSDHLGDGAVGSEAPALDGSGLVPGATEDDPGFYELTPDPAALTALRSKLEADELPSFARVRLL